MLRFTKLALFISLSTVTFAFGIDEIPNHLNQQMESNREPLSSELAESEPVPDLSDSGISQLNRFFQESPEWLADSGENEVSAQN